MSKETKFRFLKWLYCIPVAMFLLGVLYFIPFPTPVHITYTGVECTMNSTKTKEMEVTLNGTYKTYLWQEDVFVGNISLSGYDYTREGKSQEQYIRIKKDGSESQLEYYTSFSYPLTCNSLGFMYADKHMKKLVICLYDHNGWNGNTGAFACFPASNYEEAMAIAEELHAESVLS